MLRLVDLSLSRPRNQCCAVCLTSPITLGSTWRCVLLVTQDRGAFTCEFAERPPVGACARQVVDISESIHTGVARVLLQV